MTRRGSALSNMRGARPPLEAATSGRQRSSAGRKAGAALVSVLIAYAIISGWRQAARFEPGSFSSAYQADGINEERNAPSSAKLNDRATRARADPMASAPFIEAALGAVREGDDATAATLMDHAVRLDPRERIARAWLFTHELHDQHYAAAMAHAYILYQLEPTLEPTLSRTLAILAQLDDLRALIRRQFGATPYLVSILNAAPKNSLSEQASLELIAALSPPAKADAQAQLLDALLTNHDFAGVSRALRSFGLASAAGNAIYDGSFQQLAGPLPFNWALTLDDDIRAAPTATGSSFWPTALHIERFGLAAATAARQSMLVHPGRYRLSHLLKAGDVAPDHSQPPPFMWTVSCPGLPHPELARFSLGADPAARWTPRSWTVDVPDPCRLIELSLGSSFSDAAVHADALLTRVRLEPVG